MAGGAALPARPSRRDLETRIAKLERINAVLIDRVERSIDRQGSAFALFQAAIGLEAQVRTRTQELTDALRRLEHSNAALGTAKETAERADLGKTRFLAAAGHDLMQPLNAARLLMAALADLQQDCEHRRISERVERSLQTIEELIRALLDISRLDAGLVRPHPRDFALAGLFASIDSTFRPIAERKRLGFRLRPTNLALHSDPVMLQRVVQNLVSNALRYTRSGGVLVGARRRGDECLIQVSDTGIGIPSREHERIFDEFHRGALTESDDVALGLGLSIVRRQLRTLGHDLTFRSTVGVGSTFQVRVPLAKGATVEPPQPNGILGPAPLDGVAGALVVVLDNDPPTLAAMARLLDGWCCHVLPARNAAELQRLAARLERRPDLLITDYHLGDGPNGLAAVEQMRRSLGDDLPALLVSADHSAELQAASRAHRCDFLRKPLRPAALRALMSHLLARSRAEPIPA